MVDQDLVFLTECSNKELEVLVNIILEKGNFSEMLSVNDTYKKYKPDHKKYVDVIAEEIIDYGARGGGLRRAIFGARPYRDIVLDVCRKTKTPVNKAADIERMENALLEQMLWDSWEKLSEREKREILQTLGAEGTKLAGRGGLAAGALIQIFRAGGFTSYKLVLFVANAVVWAVLGRGLSLAVNAGLARALGVLTGPIGITLTALYTVYDIAGPAYRVTIPAVIYIAALRQIHIGKALWEKKLEKEALVEEEKNGAAEGKEEPSDGESVAEEAAAVRKEKEVLGKEPWKGYGAAAGREKNAPNGGAPKKEDGLAGEKILG